ncbi:MAG TPA: NUDIX domain-containing protein [Spirochaetales bacterium]|nr:NUDIX domain-containing protein [Spirochaetales bacterium]
MDIRHSVAGVALRGTTVFLARRKPGGTMGGTWEFPGGKAEDGESDTQALIREWLEEISLEVRPVRLLGQGSFDNNGTHYILSAWLIAIDRDPSVLVEHDEYRWVGEDEFAHLAMSDSDRALLPFVLPLLHTGQL